MSDSSEEDLSLTPKELKNLLSNAELIFLPKKSKERYLKTFDTFNQWRLSKKEENFLRNGFAVLFHGNFKHEATQYIVEYLFYDKISIGNET